MSKRQIRDPEGGARMSYWIASVLQDVRSEASISEEQIAISLGVNWRTIRRLEQGASMGRDIDAFVAGYAYLIGIDDARELWERALQAWYKSGSPPSYVATDSPASAFAQAIRAEARRAQARPGQTEKRRTSRRSAGGE